MTLFTCLKRLAIYLKILDKSVFNQLHHLISQLNGFLSLLLTSETKMLHTEKISGTISLGFMMEPLVMKSNKSAKDIMRKTRSIIIDSITWFQNQT